MRTAIEHTSLKRRSRAERGVPTPPVLILSIIAALAAASGRAVPAASDAPPRLAARGRQLVDPGGRPFAWRGVTAFRLVEMVAGGREAEADAYLAWASSRGLNVVRVLAMAKHLFTLTPDAGLGALPKLLELAAARGVYTEIVALADTKDLDLDLKRHVAAVGGVAARFPATFVEIANEPYHPTQKVQVNDVGFLRKLRRAVPPVVPVALGSGEGNDGLAGGDYVTVHLLRSSSDDGWEHVFFIATAEALSKRLGRLVVSDEPIGAASVAQPGSRDNHPPRFRAMGLMTRLAGLGATFHYEGGLNASLPDVTEQACLTAWLDGLDALPDEVGVETTFGEAGRPGSPVAGFDRRTTRKVYVAAGANRAWAVALGVSGNPGLRWAAGWRVRDMREWPEVTLVVAERTAGS